nr:14244_t:CDS:2 [Entrophospora candida]
MIKCRPDFIKKDLKSVLVESEVNLDGGYIDDDENMELESHKD